VFFTSVPNTKPEMCLVGARVNEGRVETNEILIKRTIIMLFYTFLEECVCYPHQVRQ
jgi:hypothetical protein